MESTHVDSLPDLATYTKQNICDNTLDDAQLARRCPLDNGRCFDASIRASCSSAGQLDRLPPELLTQVLLYTDLPSLTRFRRVSRRAMELVDSVPQYAAIIRHCPTIVRAILSIQADAFGCGVLYATLCTTRCSTCERFGDHLYLIDCRRVCYFCFTQRLEYLPLTMGDILRCFLPRSTGAQRRSAAATGSSGRQRLREANPPSVLSLPGRYCGEWTSNGGYLVRRRLRLIDRRAVVHDLARSCLPKADKTTREPRRFMAIVTAPHLFDHGRQADWGYFCLGCSEEKEEETKHFRIKYTKEEVLKHMARYGPVKETPRIPGRYMHVAQA
ncbi:F-box domain, cyclin-like protein [Niveomyces insectorum RCEF 264]|uniref:F-box domain, cyclin-like protein n=1 Tax=Niveomyces insectorum RCEF 264 TaxID=1081102 RepID=A0A162J3M9_9HYPO|nr:F-box domain, cyclin-like protein [Niveomyces insectorum RCEF 264]